MCEDEDTEQGDENIFADTMRRLQRQQAQAEQKACETLTTICAQLTERGIEIVRIDYDGYGDEGTLNSVTGYAGETEIEIERELQEELLDAGYDLLPGGWDMNSGSFGELILHVAERQVTREHNWRVESSEYQEDTFNL